MEKKLLRYLQKDKVYNDKIEITFNSPLKKSPDDNQGSFYVATFKNSFIKNKHREQQTIKAEYYISTSSNYN